jgi:hypothetical protein
MFFSPIQQLAVIFGFKSVLEKANTTANKASEAAETLKRIERQNAEILGRAKWGDEAKKRAMTFNNSPHELYNPSRVPLWQQPKYMRNSRNKKVKPFPISNDPFGSK